MTWTIHHEPSDLQTVLSHADGRRAWFSSFAAGDALLRAGVARMPADPFEALAVLLAAGLRPFKVEGVIPGLSPPPRALPQPETERGGMTHLVGFRSPDKTLCGKLIPAREQDRGPLAIVETDPECQRCRSMRR